MKLPLVRASALGALAFSITLAAHATTLYNNLAGTSGGSDLFSGGGFTADSFSTGNSPFLLTSVTLDLRLDPVFGNPADGGIVTVTLNSDKPAAPGSVPNTLGPGLVLDMIGTIDDSALTFSSADYTLTTDFALIADTRYWIELTSPGGISTANWNWSDDPSATGVTGEYYANLAGVGAFGLYQMDVEGMVTPEPSSLLLLGSGLMMLAAPLRRRRAGLRG
jgi:hypothetical protein